MRYIIANWKMNLNLADVTAWFEGFKQSLPLIPEDKEIIIAASTPYLGLLSILTKTKNLKLSAQDVSSLETGAHTGEVGAFQLKDFCAYSIVGHSERGESIEVSIKKRDLCLANGITPIFCFSDISDIEKVYTTGVILAWEDPANISKDGEYKTKPKKEIQSGVDKIRQKIPVNAVLIYGGSVNRQNVADLADLKGLNGILPGNASKDPAHFAELVLKF